MIVGMYRTSLWGYTAWAMTDKIIDISGAREERAKKTSEPQPVAVVGGTIDETSVSLCLYGDDLDPDEISRILGVCPTHAHRKGEERRSRSPRAQKPPPYKSGAWILKVRGQAPRDPGIRR